MSLAREYGCLNEDKGITSRASYLIDPKGMMRQITRNDSPVRRSVDGALRLVQAFQFIVSDLSCGSGVDGADNVRCGYRNEHEVCPANWKEGGKTIWGDPIAKPNYLAAVDGQHVNGRATGTKRAHVD
jgi:alkyl hydroperoxide reductase subunit AhpC